MRLDRLRKLKLDFLEVYPQGFNNPEMQKIAKKHNIDKLSEMAQQAFANSSSSSVDAFLEDIIRIVSRSSMVSMFEKPKFKDFIHHLDDIQKQKFSDALINLVNGQQKKGFEDLVSILGKAKLAKWSLITICLFYFDPQKEVFIKPTVTKDVINFFEIEDLVYKTTPTWEFYEKYRDVIHNMKNSVDKSIAINNAAFTGFIMMSLNSFK
ncbi:hypothetical protein fh0823_00370 [Francisella halioticida]|uniref:Uncharacterized protein n=1 Tax=Francisella halioticida TaxID=549298 RepID=A0ABN5B1E2_9GAMM|nr:hypothetical protein [Francisella halioticida]ASG67448.1 hypothetical protein CDV26_02685 [Francisella halioticida]BCD89898.1 hypothetical protein fh0823_00370 [Francisella halioticida]